ncbi:hypothetical protein EVAR_58743_1 [Eumeta japonica]|uniref:Uncharacterized protein n=1 Tax=Eumeta variegata TaxID=151549 RepID=A0A4C1YW84_EUMVA|nr:hypothetical protein EVAR_58743_1 [Eumeta japonica]
MGRRSESRSSTGSESGAVSRMKLEARPRFESTERQIDMKDEGVESTSTRAEFRACAIRAHRTSERVKRRLLGQERMLDFRGRSRGSWDYESLGSVLTGPPLRGPLLNRRLDLPALDFQFERQWIRIGTCITCINMSRQD